MKTSIFFLVVFATCVTTGLNVDWQSWFWGLATGISIMKLALPIFKE